MSADATHRQTMPVPSDHANGKNGERRLTIHDTETVRIVDNGNNSRSGNNLAMEGTSMTSPSLHRRKGSTSTATPSDGQAATDVSSSTTHTHLDNDCANTLDSNSFGSSNASLKRATSMASQSSQAGVTSNNSSTLPQHSHPTQHFHAPIHQQYQQQQQHYHPPSIIQQDRGSFLIPPGVVLYRMAAPPQPPLSTTTEPPLLPPNPLLNTTATTNESNPPISILPKEIKSGLTSRLESAAFRSPPSNSGGHHAPPMLRLNEYTPPTSLNVTPTKLFSRSGDMTMMESTDQLMLSPSAVQVAADAAAETNAREDPLLLTPRVNDGGGAVGMSPVGAAAANATTTTEAATAAAVVAAAAAAAQAASFVVGSTASFSSTSSTVTGGTRSTGTGRSQLHPQPVLYSAIGSLEHASNSFYKGWKNRTFATTHKFDFPSSTLLAPPTHVVAKRKSVLEGSSNNSNNGASSSTVTNVVRDQVSLDDAASSNKSSTIARVERQRQQAASIRSTSTGTATTSSTLRAGVLKHSTSRQASATEDDESKSTSTTRSDKKVTISSNNSDLASQQPRNGKSRRTSGGRGNNSSNRSGNRTGGKKSVIEMFRPSSDAYTPRMGKREIKYKPAEQRTPVQQMASPLGTLSRPNFRDALRRVAMILHQHIVKIERRFEQRQSKAMAGDGSTSGSVASNNPRREDNGDGLFSETMKNAFSEDRYRTPRYKCTMVRVPMARSGMVCGLKQVREKYDIPSEGEIYEFAHQLFKTVQLSSECSIVCLIYVERLMEAAKVPVLASTWRPIFMCGLLLASKVWQDLSSWNIEFASVYPQYSLESINRLELHFLRMVKWDLYISSSQYAKYYFALRSLVEKPDFRQRYNRMVGGVDNVHASQARKIEERSTMVKEEALLHLSRSM